MALDKAIKHGKEHRKTYKQRGMGWMDFDRTCRPHGGSNPKNPCPYCMNNRLLYKRAHKEWAEKLYD